MAILLNPFTGQFDLSGAGASAATVADLITLTGVPSNSTDLGTFTGIIISDNNTIKGALQQLETAVESLPDPISYQGTWSAATNTPTLLNTDIDKLGYLYQVNAAGSVNFGAGAITFEVGDKVVNNGTIWEKWDMTDAVASVNSYTGVVVLSTNDIAISGSTFNKALVSNGTGYIAESATTATELGYVSGVTSAIQTQLNAKQSTTLTDGHILVGNASNVATDVEVTGDVIISNAGVTAISSGVIVNADVNASAAIDFSKLATLASGNILLGSVGNVATSTAVTGDVVISNAGVTAISSGVIVDADINASAAIAVTKLAAVTASRALVSDASGFISAATTTSTEIGYVNGVTSSIQTQIDNIVAGTTPLTLTDAHIFVGNASNDAVDVAVTGDVTISNTGVTAISSGVIVDADINTAAAIDASKIADGTVSSTEFQYINSLTSNAQTQLNGKQATGNYITDLTGDATATGPGSVAITLATVNGNVGSFGSSTSIPSFTVNAKGLITAASGNVVIAPAGTLTGTTLASNVVTSSLTSVGTITSGTWNGTTIAIANGGTGQTTKAAAFDALSPMTTGGDLIYGGASGTGTRLANGSAGQVLQSNGTTTAPTWVTPAGSSMIAVTRDITQTAHGFVVGDWLYYNGTAYAKADADTDTTSEVLGVVSVVTDANTFTLISSGYVSTLSGLTAGTTYYLSGTPGAMTATAPTATGAVSKLVFVATSTTAGMVIHSRGIVVGGSGSAYTSEVWNTSRTFTPNSYGTPTAVNIFSKREGDSLRIRGSFLSGTTDGGVASISLPVTIDSAKLPAGYHVRLGAYHSMSSTAPAYGAGYGLVVFYDGTDTAKVYIAYQVLTDNFSKDTASSFAATGKLQTFDFLVPVSGWTQNN